MIRKGAEGKQEIDRLNRLLKQEKEQTAVELLKRNTAEAKLREAEGDSEGAARGRENRETREFRDPQLQQLRGEIASLKESSENWKRKLQDSE